MKLYEFKLVYKSLDLQILGTKIFEKCLVNKTMIVYSKKNWLMKNIL